MDIGLPDIDGLQVTAEIRRKEANKKHTPIIALTAYITDQIQNASHEAGIDNFYNKPITRDELTN